MFQVGDQTFSAHAGDYVFGPRGVPHSYSNRTGTIARAFIMVSGAGFEGFWRESSQLGGDAAAHSALGATTVGCARGSDNCTTGLMRIPMSRSAATSSSRWQILTAHWSGRSFVRLRLPELSRFALSCRNACTATAKVCGRLTRTTRTGVE